MVRSPAEVPRQIPKLLHGRKVILAWRVGCESLEATELQQRSTAAWQTAESMRCCRGKEGASERSRARERKRKKECMNECNRVREREREGGGLNTSRFVAL